MIALCMTYEFSAISGWSKTSTFFDKALFLSFLSRMFAYPGQKCLVWDAHSRCRHSCGQPPADPQGLQFIKIFRPLLSGAAKLYTSGFSGRDTFRLPLARKLPFCLRHIAKKLKDNIRYQCTSEISVLMCVQQRHVQDHDSSLLFRCDAFRYDVSWLSIILKHEDG